MIIVRLNDNVGNLPLLVKALNLERIVIISESFYLDFRTLNKRVRIALYSDLMGEPPLFNAF